MPSIKKAQKMFRGIDYIGNFLGEPIALGNIYRCDDKSFVLLANIADLIEEPDLSSITVSSRKQNITYTKESSVTVKLGAEGNSIAGKGELELNFNRKNSAFVALKDVTISQIKVELLRDQLKDLWAKKKYANNGRHIVVNQVMEAGSGTVIFSNDRNNRVVLKATSNEKLTSPAKAASGSVEFVTNTKATLEIISTEPILPMFKAFYFNRRGEIEVVG
jgi:hypothetical protein